MLNSLTVFRPHLEVLRILLYGPTGAGKSCFINSTKRILLGRNAISALEQSTQSGTSFTRTIRTHKLKKSGGGHCSFVFTDIMGLEPEDSAGILTEDVIKVLEGHISDGYTVEQSSYTLGNSLNCIYPVKNYHAEITQDPNIDVLILMALRDIINFANDYVEDLQGSSAEN